MEAAFFFVLLCFSPFAVLSLDRLKPGETLNSSAYLISSKEIFTLGFYSPDNSNRSYLGIWYTGKTEAPAWLANRNQPIYGDSGTLKISITGEVIVERSGDEPILIYKSETGTNVTATLLDTGNLVVKEMNSSSSRGDGKVVWESFDHPTDTLLPGMKLGVNHKTGKNWTLTSWSSGSNPAPGAFTLEWDWIRRRLLVKQRGVLSWTSGDLKFDYEYGSMEIHSFDYIVPKPDPSNLNYVFKNVSNQDEEYFTYSLFADSFTPENRNVVSGWTLQSQGNIFDFDRVSIARVDLCYGYNTRGVGNEVYLGCELWEQPECRNRHQMFNYTYGRFPFVDTYSYSYDNTSNLTLSDCRANCWKDCKCLSYKDEDIGCSYWRGEKAELLQDYGPQLRLRYFLVSAGSEEKRRWKIWTIPGAITLFLVSLLTTLLVIRKFRQAKKKKMKVMQELMTLEGYTGISEIENNGGHDLKMFSYASLLASTNDFSLSNKLGEGGFGPVYKGKTPEGREIATKILSRGSKQGLLEFKTELILISKLQHRNLVKLLGFCIHGNEKMIVYDYMPNKSLDFFLFDPTKRMELNWDTRFNIIEGIAQGLLYLHKHSRLLIVHRDLKAGNILLDENMIPKISDFGLARIFKPNVMEESTSNRAGTIGYMAPEYATQGIFSVKSDIYSLGILILEIVSGRRNNSFKNLEGPLILAELAWDLWKQGAELELVDPTLKTTDKEDQLTKCIQVGLLCVQDKAIDRPSIEDVASMLKSETKTLPVPKEPAFVVRNNGVQAWRKAEPEKLSANSITISAMDGR